VGLTQNLVAARKPATEEQKDAIAKAQGAVALAWSRLFALRHTPGTPDSLRRALDATRRDFIDGWGQEFERLRGRFDTGDFPYDGETYMIKNMPPLYSIIALRDAAYHVARDRLHVAYRRARAGLAISILATALSLAVAGFVLLVLVWRRVTAVIDQIACGARNLETPFHDRSDEMGTPATSIAILQDKSAEADRLAHAEAEAQSRRTADLIKSHDAAEVANRAKSTFLANMSHELRTPLNAILGFSALMQREPGLSESQKINLAIINRSGDYLLKLFNDVLDMAKIEARRMQLNEAPFDLGGMVRDITDMMQMRAREQGLRLLIDQSSAFPHSIVGDEARLRQILINLIGAALKWSNLAMTFGSPNPVMDGMESARIIRSLPGGDKVRIIAVTASTFKEEREERLHVGMDDFIRKPYRPGEIFNCLSRLMGVRFISSGLTPTQAASVGLTPEIFDGAPENQRARLQDALESLEPDRINAIIAEIGADAPELEKALAHFVERFDYPTILAVLKEL
jgi:signal transduction histidine kinase